MSELSIHLLGIYLGDLNKLILVKYILRNHNEKKIDQDPVALGPAVVAAARNALRKRYSLLPYLYTLFYFAEAEGHTVARPLFFEFPTDVQTYGSASDTQFMWGSALMVIPVLKPNETKVKAYLPSGRWYPYELELNSKPIDSTGQYIDLEAPIGKINTLLRGGSVVPILPPKQTTTQMRVEKFALVVAQSDSGTASGHFY